MKGRLRTHIRGAQDLCCLLLVFGTALTPVIAAHAESRDQSGTSEPHLEEIVVTAEKRAESIQSVPLAVSSISGDELSQMGAKSFEDIALSAPSVSFISFGPTQDKVVLRGISSGTQFESQAATTGFYLDDIPLSSNYTSGGTDLIFYDLNRVEVLRGPQGTLYGAGAEGGAIRIITTQPDLEKLSGGIDLSGGEVAGQAAQGAVNGVLNIPLVKDTLALRTVGMYSRAGGFVAEPLQGLKDVNGTSKFGYRAQLLWQPSDDFSMKLTGIYQHTRSDNPTTEDLAPNKALLYGDLTENRYIQEFGKATTVAANLAARYQMPWASIESSTSYIDNTTNRATDMTLAESALLTAALTRRTQAPELAISTLPDSDRTWVEELRLVSTETHPFKWILGGYFQHDDIVVDREDAWLPGQSLSALTPLAYLTETKRNTYAAFGEATFDITKEWHFTAGARYTDASTANTSVVYGVPFLAEGYGSLATALNGGGRVSSADFSPKGEISFTPSENVLLYAEAAKGFRPASANPVLPASVGVPSVLRPDSLWDYELGAKTSWFDGHVVANGDVFWIDWKNIQVVGGTGATSNIPNLPFLANVGKATSKGAEWELSVRPVYAWYFSLSAAYTDARFDQTENFAGFNVTKGQRIAVVPQYSGTFAAQYRRQVSPSLVGFVHFDIRVAGAAPVGYGAINQGISTSAYNTGNLRIGGAFPHDLEIALFANNLWDERGQLFMNTQDLCVSDTTACYATLNPNKTAKLRTIITQPRSLGITISKQF